MSFMDHPNHGAEEPPSYAAASSSSSHTSDLTSSYASIYMQGRDKLRFLHLPEPLVLALEQQIHDLNHLRERPASPVHAQQWLFEGDTELAAILAA